MIKRLLLIILTLGALQACAPKPLEVSDGYAIGNYTVVGLSISQHHEKNMLQSRLNAVEFNRVEPQIRNAISQELQNIRAAGPSVNVFLKIVHAKLGKTIEPKLFAELSVVDSTTNQLIFTKQGVGYGPSNSVPSGGGLIGAIGAGIAKGILDATEGEEYEATAIQQFAKRVVTTLYPNQTNK